MLRSRLCTVVAVAGVLGFGAAAMTQCGTGGGVTPPTSTTTTTATTVPSLPQGQLAVSPADGAPGAAIGVQGSWCISDFGQAEIFLATSEDPSTHVAESYVRASPYQPGNWSAELTIPQGVAPGSDYLIEAQCWGDGTPFGHPGQQVEYFAYNSSPFTVDAAP
jgi:hypothetical protein